LVVRWRPRITSVGVDADGATPCAEDAGGVAAAQDALGLNAEGVGSTWGNKSWVRRGRLARPDANPITLWIVIEPVLTRRIENPFLPRVDSGLWAITPKHG
jgi:hypothetical protein